MRFRKYSAFEIGLALIIVGIVMAFASKDYFLSFKEPVNMYYLSPEEIKPGLHIQTDIDMVWDVLYTETTTNTTYGIKTSERESARGYILPLVSLDDEGYVQIDKFMAMKISRSTDYTKVEKIMDETYDWWIGEADDFGYTTLPVEGKIVKLQKDEKELMMEYLTTVLEMSSQEAEEYMFPYKLVPINPSGSLTTLIIGAVLVVLGAITLIIYAKKKKKDKEDEARMIAYSQKQAAQNLDPYAQSQGAFGQTVDTYGQDGYGQSTYGQSTGSYGQSTFGQSTDSYGQSTYGQSTYGQSTDSYGQSTYGQSTDSYGQSTYGQSTDSYGQSTYGQSTDSYGQSTYGQSTDSYNQNPYGQQSYGYNTGANPLYQNQNATGQDGTNTNN